MATQWQRLSFAFDRCTQRKRMPKSHAMPLHRIETTVETVYSERVDTAKSVH
jgi:hypothetical protein